MIYYSLNCCTAKSDLTRIHFRKLLDWMFQQRVFVSLANIGGQYLSSPTLTYFTSTFASEEKISERLLYFLAPVVTGCKVVKLLMHSSVNTSITDRKWCICCHFGRKKSSSSQKECCMSSFNCVFFLLLCLFLPPTPVFSLWPSSWAGPCWTPTLTTRWTSWRTGRTSSRTWWCTMSSVARMKSSMSWWVVEKTHQVL